MKKKILIIENFVHYRNAIESLKLFKKDFSVNLIIPYKDRHRIEKKFYKNCFFFKGPTSLIYFYVLIKSLKYDFILISTLPEYPPHLKTIKNLLFFIIYYSFYFILSAILNHKLILQIRNIEAFDKRKKTSLNYVRNLFLKFTDKYICETKFIAERFKYKILNNKKAKVTYQYINHYEKHHYNGHNKKKQKVYIGILGAIDDKKKNYTIIRNSFSKLLKKNKHIDVTLIFLGKILNPNSHKVLKEFNNLNIKYFNKYISEKDFQKWGSKCLFLISSINNSRKYGIAKPTGSFGDAIYLKKQLLINHSTDPLKEFKSFSTYFKNENEFYKNIKKILNNKISFRFKFEKYLDRKKNIKRIRKILEI